MKELKTIHVRVILSAFVWVLSLGLFAQNVTVRGVVSDVNGEPLIGVTLLVQGTTNGTVTNIDGEYTLSGVPSNGVIEVSYVGMQNQNVQVGGRSIINITLTEDTERSEERRVGKECRSRWWEYQCVKDGNGVMLVFFFKQKTAYEMRT